MPRVTASLAMWRKVRQAAFRIGASQPGVVGVDFGVVRRNGLALKTLGLRFHVLQKQPRASLSETQMLPVKLGSLRCDVLQASYALSNEKSEAGMDFLELGASVGNLVQRSGGTLGMFVLDRLSDKAAILSNWHVLAGSAFANPGEVVGHPAPTGTFTSRVVGNLERWLDLDIGYDAAIAQLSDGISWRQELSGLAASVRGIAEPVIGMQVVKVGARTGLTHGIVEGTGGAYKVNYTGFGDTWRWMYGIHLVQDPRHPETEISMRGDSGAAWIDPTTGCAVALQFGGEDGLGPTSEYALAHPMPRIFSMLNLKTL